MGDMYNRKYVLKNVEEFGKHNPIYDEIKSHICYLVYLNPGERGWFLHEIGLWFEPPHRVHTSIVKEVLYENNRGYEAGRVIVTTEHTKFTFELI